MATVDEIRLQHEVWDRQRAERVFVINSDFKKKMIRFWRTFRRYYSKKRD